MRLGISAKLFLGILIACAIVLIANGVAGRIIFERGFMGYLNEQGEERMREILPRLQQGYVEHGNWDFVRGNPDAWFGLMRPASMQPGMPLQAPPVSDQIGAVPRFALLDTQLKNLIGNPEAGADAVRLPIEVQGQTVGWLAMVPFQKAIAGGELRFYEAQVRAWWINGAVSVAVAALIAWLLSRALLWRVGGLTGAVHRLAAGDYGHRVPRVGKDELGRLAADVNRLAETLENTESSRRAFMADISHELRTPLAVVRAELEAIQDGIRPLSQEALTPLHGEVRQLGKLIDDLHELSLTQTGSMAYRFAPVQIAAVLDHVQAGMRGRFADAGLTLDGDAEPAAVLIQGDERRLQQLFSNLLENALRYTDGGGRVQTSVRQHDGQAEVVIEDSAPGVDEAHRERLFERFYRVENSRNRATGGSGLGLAISQNIVITHGGSIHAEASALGGLRIVIRFPVVTA